MNWNPLRKGLEPNALYEMITFGAGNFHVQSEKCPPNIENELSQENVILFQQMTKEMTSHASDW